MSLCNSCGSKIRWVSTVVTKKMAPLDVEPRPDGNVVIRNGQAHYLSANNPVQPDELRYVSHFSTCIHAAEHRKR